MLNEKRLISTRDLVLTALMIALVFLAGSVIKVPSLGGFIHIGDTMVFLSVVVLGRRKGTIASSIGMFLVDVFAGYYMWAPFTLVIKGVMAYIVGTCMEKINSDDKLTKEFKPGYIVAFILGGIFMVIGYFLAGTVLAAFLTEKIGLIQGIVYASKDIVGNIIQVVTGIILAIPLSTIVISAKRKVFN